MKCIHILYRNICWNVVFPLQAVPLAECKDNVVGSVLKVLLHSLTCNQSTTFLSHTFSTLRALVVKVL